MTRIHTLLQDIQSYILGKDTQKPSTETQQTAKNGLWGLEDSSPKQMVDMVPEYADIEKMDNLTKEFYEMSATNLLSMHDKITELLALMKTQNNLQQLTQPWVQSKITLAGDYVASVYDFLMFGREPTDKTSTEHDQSEKIVQPDYEHLDEYTVTYPYNTMEAKDGLWDNIRKKREREGKNYKPAKTQKEGRPDPKTWKELTKKKK